MGDIVLKTRLFIQEERGLQEWWVEGVLQSRKQIERRIKQLGLSPLSASVKINTAPEPPDFLNMKLKPVTNATSQEEDFDLGRLFIKSEDNKKVLH